MALLLQDRKDEEVTLFADCYREIYGRFFDFQLQKKTIQYLKIKAYLEPLIFQKIFSQNVCIPYPQSVIDDTISRSASWSALFEDKPLPNVEEYAVEKYAGSLDQYLPENVPIDNIIKHAKG